MPPRETRDKPPCPQIPCIVAARSGRPGTGVGFVGMGKAIGPACVGALVLALAAVAPGSSQAGYETAPTFTPSQALPPELVQGPNHAIVGSVPVDGFLDRFRMQTKW